MTSKKRLPSVLLASALALLGFSTCPAGPAQADDQAAARPYSGDVLTRTTLTGDWGGLRNDLAGKGVTFDLNLAQTEQGVVSGGKSSRWHYGGRGDLVVKVDTDKLGLWPGGFLTAELEGNFGNNLINPATGALMPVDANQIYPNPGNNNQLNIPALNFAQFLSRSFGVVAGKLDTVATGDQNEFASGGKGDRQFMNLALNINPALMMTVPYSTLGAGMIILPTQDPNEAVVALSVLSTEGKPYNTGFDYLDGNKLTFIGEGRVRTGFFDRTGHQLLGFSYSNKNFKSLDQRFGDFASSRQLQSQQDSWAVFYNFDQYFYEPEKGSGRGIGIFGRFAVTDGNPNPVHYMWSLGVGGKGAIPGRPNDRFGLGYYHLVVNQPRFTIPFPANPLFQNEYGVEAFYTAALTPWLLLTPDVQVLRPTQRDTIEQSGPLIHKKSINTATILGLRLQIVF